MIIFNVWTDEPYPQPAWDSHIYIQDRLDRWDEHDEDELISLYRANDGWEPETVIHGPGPIEGTPLKQYVQPLELPANWAFCWEEGLRL